MWVVTFTVISELLGIIISVLEIRDNIKELRKLQDVVGIPRSQKNMKTNQKMRLQELE